MRSLTKNEDLKYQLATLTSYEPNDLDYPEFEVFYSDLDDNEGSIEVCCIDVAERALDRIKALEQALSWAKNDWTGNEPSESVMHRYFDELNIK